MSGARLPVTVIGGYLGTGKTTLVNRLLRAADGQKLAVLVNDFGATPIDRDLIVSSNGDTLEISGGCVCCSYGSDLMDTLMTLPVQRPDVERVVLETSGVALPGMVASAVTLLAPYRIDGIVVMVDVETVRTMAEDAYLGDTITRQLSAADLVVANRCDLVDDASLQQTLAWLALQSPSAQILAAIRADIAPDLLLGLRDGALPRLSATLATPGAPDAASLYESLEVDVPEDIDVSDLGRRLSAPGTGVLRAKGILNGVALHVVGRRFEIDAAPAGAKPGRLVVIGLRARLDRRAVEQALQPRLSTSLRSA
ncbi:CobW family GTP-binding protein [Reyranella sp.]|uniref:CobW family GTP-binding protein n=1 Tax=Reyranella sp. TaxID=1929291 RepID=UPI004036D9EB